MHLVRFFMTCFHSSVQEFGEYILLNKFLLFVTRFLFFHLFKLCSNGFLRPLDEFLPQIFLVVEILLVLSQKVIEDLQIYQIFLCYNIWINFWLGISAFLIIDILSLSLVSLLQIWILDWNKQLFKDIVLCSGIVLANYKLG